MIVFEKIKYKNILSVGNDGIEISLNKYGNTGIYGKNGSGKSLLLDAICFSLFGKAFRSINKSSLVNSINKKELIVEIEFTTKNKKYKIIRGIKPNIFEIYENGSLIQQESNVKDYQEILEKKILRFNFKSFTQIVILGSASFVPFMQLSQPERRIIIEDLLNIQIFSTMNQVVKSRISTNKEEVFQKKSEIGLLEQQYNIKKFHYDSLLKDNSNQIEEYENEKLSVQAKIRFIEKKIQKFKDRIKELESFLGDSLKNRRNYDDIKKDITLLENRKSLIIKELNFLKDKNDCPTCKQEISSEYKENRIRDFQIELEEIKKGQTIKNKSLSEINEKIKVDQDNQDKINKNKTVLASNDSIIRESKTYIDKLNSKISELKSKKKIDDIDEEFLNNLLLDIENRTEEYKSLLEEKKYYDTIGLLLKDSGIKTQIIKQYLPVMNRLINKHLSALDFFVNFQLDENFKETIKSRHRDDFNYNNFSEGEKARINLALLFTWREIAKIKNSNYTNLLILDEIFDSSLDNFGIDYLLNTLHSMENVNIFIISHKGDVINDKFDRMLEFNKTKNFTRMVEK